MKTSILHLVFLLFLGISCTPSSHISSTHTSAPSATDAVANKTDKAEAETADAAHSSRHSLDWAGTYQGTAPCADCAGIETEIELTSDHTYMMHTRYVGKKDMIPLERKGSFSWNATGMIITLQGASQPPPQYKVIENGLIQLDTQGHTITGNLADSYVLRKTTPQAAPQLVATRWRLVELRGKAIGPSTPEQEPFIQLTADENRISGYTGCNHMTGTYTQEEGNRLQFSQLIGTKKACPDMSVESELLQILRIADNYAILGNRLSLYKARMAPLARFEAIEE